MDYPKFEVFASPPRLNRYLHLCGTKADVLSLYQANIRISQSFYPILSLYEVFLRNTICNAFTDHFKDKNWILTQSEAKGFLTKTSRKPHSEKVHEYLNKCKNPKMIPAGKVVAEMSLGFWVGLFRADYHGLMEGIIKERCFPNRPKPINRKHIYTRMENVRIIRNRVFHNEPICFGKKGVDLADTRRARVQLFELLRWMDTDAHDYVAQYDQVEATIKEVL